MLFVFWNISHILFCCSEWLQRKMEDLLAVLMHSMKTTIWQKPCSLCSSIYTIYKCINPGLISENLPATRRYVWSRWKWSWWVLNSWFLNYYRHHLHICLYQHQFLHLSNLIIPNATHDPATNRFLNQKNISLKTKIHLNWWS